MEKLNMFETPKEISTPGRATDELAGERAWTDHVAQQAAKPFEYPGAQNVKNQPLNAPERKPDILLQTVETGERPEMLLRPRQDILNDLVAELSKGERAAREVIDKLRMEAKATIGLETNQFTNPEAKWSSAKATQEPTPLEKMPKLLSLD